MKKPLAIVILSGALLVGQAPVAVTLSPAVSPAIGQAGSTSITITGSGFPAGTIQPADVAVLFEPAAGGASVTNAAATLTTVAGSTRRVSSVIPGSINIATPAQYLISLTGKTATGTAFASTNKVPITINPGGKLLSVAPASGQVGQTLSVTISGQFTNFVQGSTQANFGAGISVGGSPEGSLGSLTVTNATTATAQIRINASAAAGPRNVLVRTGIQDATLPAGFAVTGTNPTPGNPSISDFNPKSGSAGTLVSIAGANFGQNPQVSLSKQGGGSITAPLATSTPTAMTFTVPAGASTGPITVTAGGKTVVSTVLLTIVPSADFTLTALPGVADLIQGQSVSFAVNLSSSNGFAKLAALTVSGVPNGITASFKPQQMAAGQTSILTLSAPSTQSLSTATLNIAASSNVDGLPVSANSAARLNVVAPSTTFLGRTVVDDSLQTPLAGVTVRMLGEDGNGGKTGCTGTTISDPAGNFVLPNLPSSCVGPQLVGYDGLTVTSPAGKYAGVNILYTLALGRATPSPVFVHLPRIDDKETFQVQQNSSVDQTYAYKTIPGLSVTVYRGTTFTLPDGSTPNPFPLIAAQVPVDRLPDYKPPVPTMLLVFIVAFQPANTKASQPVAVYYPNTINTQPGVNMTMMTLDPTRGRMLPYGTATVSTDGTQIIPDLDPSRPGRRYGIVNFDWHGAMPPPNNDRQPKPCPPPPPVTSSNFCPLCPDTQTENPVQLSSGIETYAKSDLSFGNGRGRINFVRMYRTLSKNVGPFGLGGNHHYNYSLDAANPGSAFLINLVTPEWSFIPFTKQGSVFVNASAMLGATMTVASDNSVALRFKDGVVYQFSAPTFAALPQLQSIADANGNAITLTRDTARPVRIIQISDPAGRSLTLNYDASDRITDITDPIGRVVRYTYDPAFGTLATVTDAKLGVHRYTYSAPDRLFQEIDARKITIVENTYDSNGRVISQKHPDGGVLTIAYTLVNPLVATSPVLQTILTDPRGNKTTYRFSPEQHLLDITDALGQTSVFGRDPATNLITQTVGPGACQACGSGAISSTYDATGNLTSRTDELGNKTSYTYDPNFNKVASITDALGFKIDFVYDGHGNLKSRTDPNKNTTLYVYDAFGQLVETEDALHTKTQFGYDATGNLISVTDPAGKISRFRYDALSRQLEVRDALGRSTLTAYDDLNRVTQQTDAKGRITMFGYDEVGNLTAITDARQQTTVFAYDRLNRLATRKTPSGRSDSRLYDFNGNLIQFTDRRTQVSRFTYDQLDRLVIETYQDSTVVRTYDAKGSLQRVTDSMSGDFVFSFDLARRLVQSISPYGTVQYTRDARGRVKTRQVIGAPVLTYNYDPAGNLAGASMPGASVGYTYDALNRPATLTRGNGVNSKYSYDTGGRITSILHAQGASQIAAIFYGNDDAGQRISMQSSIGRQLATQSALAQYDADNRLITRSASAFIYDEAGNLASETAQLGTVSYTWDSRGRLASILSPGGQGTKFVYDFVGNMVEQRDLSSGTRLQAFINDNLSNVAQYSSGSNVVTSVLTALSVDSHLAVLRNGVSEYILGDAVGSTVTVSDSSGQGAAESYEPFGQSGGVNTLQFNFTGRSKVNNTLLFYRSRFYNPVIARFISEDSLKRQMAGENPYVYVSNNPVTFTDPYGLTSVDDASGTVRPDPNFNPLPGTRRALLEWIRVEILNRGADFVCGLLLGQLGEGPLADQIFGFVCDKAKQCLGVPDTEDVKRKILHERGPNDAYWDCLQQISEDGVPRECQSL